MIPYGRQDISEADIEAVISALRSDFITQGPTVEKFEQSVADYCGARHAIAVSNATAALHLACLALKVGEGDSVWTSPNTFVASANCARFCGADVDFIDIDPNTWNLSPTLLEMKLKEAKAKGALPKVLIPVHFSGQSCAMDEVGSLAEEFGVSVIEDASHAIGGTFRGDPVGCCKYSDCAIFSFHPVKIVTTGEGGIIVTNRDDLAACILLLRSHGITRDPRKMAAKNPEPWYYEQLGLGYNYRMTDIQAALGASQMTRIEAFVSRRRILAARYDELLSDLPIQLQLQDTRARSSWHLYVIRLRLDQISRSHRQVFEGLRGAGIGVNLHYIPVHLQPYYRALGFAAGHCPEAERYYGEAISLPLYPALSETDQDYIVTTLRELLA